MNVTAVETSGGHEASTEIIRPENVLATEIEAESNSDDEPKSAGAQDDFQVEEWADSTSAAAIQLPTSDIEILDLPSTRGPADQPSQPTRKTTKPRRRRKQATGDQTSKKKRSAGDRKASSSGQSQAVRPPPLPPGLNSSQDSKSGEEEFWNLPEA